MCQEPCQCTTLKVLNRNGIQIVYTSSLKSKENMEQRNLLGFCDYVTLLTMICMRLNMRNRIFVLPREKCNDSLKMKERGGGGGEDDDDDDDVY